MKRKVLTLGLGIALGYVLGARAGRARYEQIKSKAVDVWENPRVARARHDVEAYAKEQAPIIRDRAEAAVKAAPGVAKDVAEKAAATAKDVASSTAATAKDVAEKVTTTAKDVAEKVTTTSKDVAGKVSTTSKDVAGKVSDTVADTAAHARERGEAAVDKAVTSAGKARDEALDVIDDEDDTARA